MIDPEIVRSVRLVNLRYRRLAGSFQAGSILSRHLGKGLEFEEVRRYESGDESKDIDWKITARRGIPYVKRYAEDRHQSAWLVLDESASMSIGQKRRTALDALALIGLASANQGDRTGILTFGPCARMELPTRDHRRLLGAIARLQAHALPTSTTLIPDARAASRRLQRTSKTRSLIAVASDFLAPDSLDAWLPLAHRHQILALHVVDEAERQLPTHGLGWVRDLETGQAKWIDGARRGARASYAKTFERRELQMRQDAGAHGMEVMRLDTDQSVVRTLIQRFGRRRRHRA